jgi:hypothetical protein
MLALEIHFPGMHNPEPCFLLSIKSVLDLNAFERQNKAAGLGMVTEEGTREYHGPFMSEVLINPCWSELTLAASQSKRRALLLSKTCPATARVKQACSQSQF